MTKVLRPQQVPSAVGATAEQIKAEGLEINRAGGAAYKSSGAQALLTYLTTGGVGNTYYAEKSVLENEARALFKKFASSDPMLLAKSAIYAREKGLMRSAPISALVYLSTGDSRAFHAAFPRIVKTPGDLADVWKLVRGASKVRGVGRSIRTATGRWLSTMSPYHAIKYGATSQEMSLADIIKLARPHNLTAGTLPAEQDALIHYLVKGELTAASPAQLRGYHEFKAASADIATLLQMVETHKLPWEVVAPQLGGGDAAEKLGVWKAMSFQMPYMALLRNLNNLLKYGVLDDSATRQVVLGRLADATNVAYSKQFPFRFISAIRAVEASEHSRQGVRSEVVDALKQALNHSVNNLPESIRSKRVLVVLDVSGSMGNTIGSRSYSSHSKVEPMTYVDVGAVFAASAYKGAGVGSRIITFDDSVHAENNLSRDMGVYNIATTINHRGGGTALSAPIRWALDSKEPYDVMVFITDSESWVNEMGGRDGYGYGWRTLGETASNAMLRAYREKVNSEMKAFFIQLCPTQTQMTAPDLPGTYYISGWSNSVLDYIGLQVEGGTNMLETVRAIEL